MTKCIDKKIRDGLCNWINESRKQAIGNKGRTEVDPATCLAQGFEAPLPLECVEWSLH